MVVYSLDVGVSIHKNAVNGSQMIVQNIALTTINSSFFFIKRYWLNIDINSFSTNAYLRH